ncbi:hypothetical protein [Neobacillus cucumis]|uniref:PepSY domain-containing protein n=1 Tax=Neobacillus cucumis TaxID=1740721 RepID=A0A2N5H929_9BACI|nr:hypothetical protein [Neobacillus cucumis]PLS02033.1 hypothetical protein CVD27_22320 [Neobacillus cucumis]
MNWKTFFLGAAVGMISGYMTKEILCQNTNVTPEKVLGAVKKQFKQNGPISGSWIHMTSEPYEKNLITYNVYKGGISQNHQGLNEQFEFIADAKTGALLEVTPFSNEPSL